MPYVEGQGSYDERLNAYGQFIGGLAPWTEFVTLMHRPRTRKGSWARVGIAYHRRMVRNWFYGKDEFRGFGVRDIDPNARMWSETELHLSGVPHEHGLIWTEVDMTERKAMRDRWRGVCGDLSKGQGAYFEHIRSVSNVAVYVAKYTVKSASKAPRIFGFGTATLLTDAVGELAWAKALTL